MLEWIKQPWPCPGPLFAQIGSGAVAVLLVLLSAIAGTWVYGYFREQLPH